MKSPLLPVSVRSLFVIVAGLFLLYAGASSAQGIIPTKGTDFWIGFPYNPQFSNSIGTKRCDVFITSDVSTSGTISIPLQGWSQSFTVTAYQTTTITLPISQVEHVASEVIESKGVHVVTGDTVSVFALSFQKYTADASVIYPKQTLGTQYRIASYKGISNSSPGNLSSDFLIVARTDGTQVRVTPTTPTLGGKPAGTPFVVKLNAGQSYQVIASTYTGDFTGTLLEGTDSSGSCRTFAVFSGSACVNIPQGCTACDIIYDQALPVPTWGKTYYVAPFSFATGYTIRVLAHQNGTVYTVNGGAPVTLNAGQYTEINNITTADCIQGNKPLSVIQYMQGVTCSNAGDPAMVYVNSDEAKMDNVTFSTITSTVITQHDVNVIMKAVHQGQLTLDGVHPPPASFTPIPSCPGIVYAQLSLTQGSHTLIADSGFSAYVYGTGDAESYAYSVGSYSKSQPIKVDSLLCTSDTLHIGTTQNLFGQWWATQTNPNDTIHVGPVLTLTPPIVPDVYVLHGNEYISGCAKESYFNVEVPTPPTVSITQSADTVCKYQPVQLKAKVLPNSSIYVYNWTPVTGLTNPHISNPVATPPHSMWYVVGVSSPNGCGGIVYDSTYIYVRPGAVSRFDVAADDSVICKGESTPLKMTIEKPVLEDDFDPLNNALWSQISGGVSSNACSSVTGNALYFNGAGSRFAATGDLNVLSGGTIQFALEIAAGVAPCEDADFGEDVVLEYSTNAGGVWNNITTYYESQYPSFTLISVPIPAAAKTAATRFRWRQLANSGVGQDNWGLDNVIISSVNSTGLTFSWTPATGLSATNIMNPVATPTASTLYIGQAYDNVTGCTYADSVYIAVGPNFTLSTLHDTILCLASGIPLHTTPSSPATYTYLWSPGSTLSDSTSQNPLATPKSSITYRVTVTSNFGCVKTDSIKIRVVSLGTFNAIPDSSSICVGQTVQADVFKSSGCGTNGSVCSGTPSTATVAPGFYSTTSTGTSPYSASYTSGKHQYLYTASELAAAGITQGGTISSIGFDIDYVYGTGVYNNFTIKMGCVADSELTSTFVTGLSTVFTPKNVTLVAGWTNHVLDNTYDWDGTSNIVVEICYQNPTYSSNSGVYYLSTVGIMANYNYGSSVCNMTTGYTSYSRPNIMFKYCQTPPAPGLVYSWLPINGVSNPHIKNPVLSPVTTTNYIVTATDTASGCVYSDNVKINVGPVFNVTASNDTQLCVASGVPLSVSHTAGAGASYHWSPGSLLSDSTVYNPLATPKSTIMFHVSVTSALGCTREDSVKVKVVSLASFDAIPDTASICSGQTVQADILKSNGCGTNGSVCTGAPDSVLLAYNTYSSSSTGNTPYAASYLSSRRQFLYTASELAVLGMSTGSTISQIAFNIATLYGNGLYQNFTIKMGCVADSELTTTFVPGLVTVFNPKNITATAGLNNYVFDNTYDWDGTSNLVVEICYQNTTTGSNSSIYYHYTGFYSSLYQYGNSVCNMPTGYNYYYRPNTTFKYCKTPAGTGLTFLWTPVAGVSNTTIKNPILSPVTTTTYTVVATDTATGCVFSDRVTVNVGAPFTIAASNDTILCAASGVPLSVSHTAGAGATYLWTPGSFVSDSTTATTQAHPQVTTVYHIAVKSANGCTEEDSVKVRVVSAAIFDATPDSSSICLGQSVQADVFKSNGCGTNGSVCSGVPDSVTVAYNTYSSSSTAYTPYAGSYISSRHQFLFTASELAALGMTQGSTISQLAFNVAYVYGTGQFQGFTIKMGCTALTDMTTTFVPGLFTVFNPKNITITTGVNNYVLDNTYDWDGTSNLLVEVCYQNATSSSNSTIYYHYTGFNSNTYYYGSTGTCSILTGYTTYYRPNTTFKYCKTPAATGLIYAWTPVAGVSNPAIKNPVLTPLATTNYQVLATDTATGCVFSDNILMHVGAPFTIAASNDTVLCLASGVPLQVSHTGGAGAVIQWTPGQWLNDSTIANPMATPQLTSVFYVSVKSVDGCIMTDSVKVRVAGLSTFDATPDTASICSGGSVQADVFKSNSCGTNGSVCTGTLDSAAINYGTYNSTSTSTTPYSATYTSARRQYLFTAAELATAGMGSGGTISQLAFRVAYLYGNGQYQNFTIKMGCTQLTELTTTFVPGLFTVFNPKNVTVTAGYNNYTFDNAYDWDGTSNLIVEVCYQNSLSGSSSAVYYNSTAQYSTTYAYGSTGQCGTLTGYATYYRPNTTFRFCKTPADKNLVFAWTPAAGVSNTGIKNPLLTPATTTSYLVTATDTVTGCKFTDKVDITVGTTNLVIQASNDTSVCSALGIVLHVKANSAGPFNYSWQPANRLNYANDSFATIIVDGSQKYIVSVSDPAGCSVAKDTVNITVSPPATIHVANDTAMCPGDSIQLYAFGGLTYLWSPANGLSNTNSSTPKASPQNTTTYQLKVTDSLGCIIYDSVKLNVLPTPIVHLGNDTSFCQGGHVVYSAGAGFNSYLWQDNSTDSTFNAVSAGVYWVEVTNQCGADRDSAEVLQVYIPPAVNVGADTTLCMGAPLILDAGYPGSSYTWTGNVHTQTLGVTTSGVYAAYVTDNHGCTGGDSMTANFITAPIVNIGNDTTLCSGKDITLDAGNAGAAYLWSTQDVSQTILVNSAGNYWVKVTNSVGCSTYDTMAVIYLPVLSVNLGPDTTLCSGQPLVLDAGNPGLNYLWSNNLATQTINPTATGSYWVKVSLNGLCAVYDTVDVTFVPSPIINLGNDTALCQGHTVDLDAGNAGSVFHWSTGASSQVITADSGQIYSVQVINSFNCPSTDSISITVNPLPVVNLGSDTMLCAGNSFTLNAGNPGATYHWSTNAISQSIVATSTNNYSVVVTDVNGCTGQSNAQITFKPLPQLTVTNDSAVCQGDSLLLIAFAPDGQRYQWWPTTALSDPTSARTWSAPTGAITYNVAVWDSVGCSDTGQVSVSLHYLPTVSIGNDTSICVGKQVTFDAGAGYSSYLWQNGSVAQTFTTSQTGNYWVKVGNQCGYTTDSAQVLQLYPLPVVNLGPGGMFCSIPAFTLDAGNAGSTYRWSTGETSQLITPANSGNYAVAVTSQYGCIDSGSVSIELVDWPVVDLGNDTLLCGENLLQLNVEWQYSTYLWQDGSTNHDYTVGKAGLYWVNVTNLCGTEGDSILVEYNRCECKVYVPNVFTPNNDGFNDVFKPEFACDMRYFDMMVFDRWGELVFQSDNPLKGWDGTFKGVKMTPAVFVYVINYVGLENTNLKPERIKGSVTLLK